MNIWKLVDQLKSLVIYDADKEFYAKVFPGSVSRKDLMRLRRMDMEDLPFVLTIEGKNYNFPWSEEIFKDCVRSPHYSNWVCTEKEKIIAYSIVSMAGGEAHIMNICVDPDAKRLGLGSKLLENIIENALGKVETIFLEVRPSNEGAMALYKKRGFTEIGVRKDYYPAVDGEREDAVMLSYELGPIA